MKQFLFTKYTAIFCIILASACTKVIDINLNDAAPQIVIQGAITNEAGPYTVKITRSISFNSDNVYPAVTGAIVVVTDDSTNAKDTLSESAAGIYSTHAITNGIIGHTYHLYIKVGGVEYTATSTMPKQVLLDTVTFQTNTGFGNSVTNAIPNFQDPPNGYNAYHFLQKVNGKPVKQIFVFDDRLSDGRYISRQLFNDSSYINDKDTVLLEMQCIDKPIFEYYKQLSGQDPTNGQPTSPANPTTNISNNALGYFSAHTVQRDTAVFRK